MDIYELKFTPLQNEILRLFCIKAGVSLNQRRISKLLKVSPTAVSKAIKSLGKDELLSIKKDKQSNIVSIELNRDSEKVINYKRTENLRLLYESGFYGFIKEMFPGGIIILFGSYSLGEDTIKSDIDIAIIGSKQKDIDLSRYELLLERKILINFYENIKIIDKNLLSNIINGITLTGVIKIW